METHDLLKKLLLDHELTIATAESLTGGNLAGRITSVSGSSAYFRGGVVAYTLDSKVALLGVQGAHAAAHDCVSPLVASQMAEGVRKLFKTDIGVATTGYAESSLREDGTLRAPMAYIAVSFSDGRTEWERVQPDWPRSRVLVQQIVAEMALHLVLDEVAHFVSRQTEARGQAEGGPPPRNSE